MEFNIQKKPNENLHRYPTDDLKVAQRFAQQVKNELGDFLIAVVMFGSSVRRETTALSDIDVLVSFVPGADWSLFDHIRMEEEFSTILGRNVDIVTRRTVERSDNWIRRKAILESAVPCYVER